MYSRYYMSVTSCDCILTDVSQEQRLRACGQENVAPEHGGEELAHSVEIIGVLQDEEPFERGCQALDHACSPVRNALSRSFSSRRRILPEASLGIASMNSILYSFL